MIYDSNRKLEFENFFLLHRSGWSDREQCANSIVDNELFSVSKEK